MIVRFSFSATDLLGTEVEPEGRPTVVQESVAEFRARVRDWLAAHVPRRGDATEASIADQKAFQASLHAAGFAGITWPREYGGQGLTSDHQIAFDQESRTYDLPVSAFMIGLGMPGPTILECGTEQQRSRFLPKLLSGEEIWCQLFSEPSGGSDVAALITSAVPDGDGWLLNGQKVWTSGAQYCDFGAVLARTNPDVPKHNGITMFIVDMHSPGVTVRPLRVASGGTPFNQVFFDDVRLPPDSVIGDVNDGWRAAVIMLRNERISIGTRPKPSDGPLSYRSLSRFCPSSPAPLARRIAELYARERSVNLLGQLLREESGAGRSPGPRGSVSKLATAELELFAAVVAQDVIGAGIAHADDADVSAVLTAIIDAPGRSIAGGTNEIQRNIIGERILGLPKDPGVDRSVPFRKLKVGTQPG
jgi:alkylation response protein AidB-like acyl-CoA dehydrogenase